MGVLGVAHLIRLCVAQDVTPASSVPNVSPVVAIGVVIADLPRSDVSMMRHLHALQIVTVSNVVGGKRGTALLGSG